MPDKPLTVITYAASASLAAVALVYFFNPNYLIDNGGGSASARKKGVVGLTNSLNDCFINSVLQALAGLGDLRLYLIRELHRRKLSDPQIYRTLPEEEDGRPINRRKLLGLQSGDVTQGLKNILDQLNERPIHKKVVSARPFIQTLERAFETHISRDQQDAQELLQVVAERVCDEYHAGRDARRRARKDIQRKLSTPSVAGLGLSVQDAMGQASPSPDHLKELEQDDLDDGEEEVGFPLEGQTESQIECQHCGFVPKSNPVSFVMLTLSVPQKSSATLNECFDAQFKREIIDDYRCDRCRLEHAVSVFQKDLAKETSASQRQAIQEKIEKLQLAIETDPEKPPEDVKLPDSKTAPTRKIERHVKITQFPQILVIHLSRSIFDVRSSSAKNMAKVSFPEQLPLGGLIDRRNYKLLGTITHKGTHNSGHYECFRRQHVYAPFSTPIVDPELGPYSRAHTPSQSHVPSPRITTQTPTPSTSQERVVLPRASVDPAEPPSTASSSSPSFLSERPSSASTRPSSASLTSATLSPTSLAPKTERSSLSTARTDVSNGEASTEEASTSRRSSIATATMRAKSLADKSRMKRKKRPDDRWWRISDDKIKECKTSDVLDMQREVYLLFYEMERA